MCVTMHVCLYNYVRIDDETLGKGPREGKDLKEAGEERVVESM